MMKATFAIAALGASTLAVPSFASICTAVWKRARQNSRPIEWRSASAAARRIAGS